jgi:hypothetical protein
MAQEDGAVLGGHPAAVTACRGSLAPISSRAAASAPGLDENLAQSHRGRRCHGWVCSASRKTTVWNAFSVAAVLGRTIQLRPAPHLVDAKDRAAIDTKRVSALSLMGMLGIRATLHGDRGVHHVTTHRADSDRSITSGMVEVRTALTLHLPSRHGSSLCTTAAGARGGTDPVRATIHYHIVAAVDTLECCTSPRWWRL